MKKALKVKNPLENQPSRSEGQPSGRGGLPSKKERILSLYASGLHDLDQIAVLIGCRPSYVSQVLYREHLIQGYFDLYTSTGAEQNVYSRLFRGVLAFRNVEAARESVRRIDALYRRFEAAGDRGGQHHAMVVALIGLNRARWSGKAEESKVFREWLCARA